MLPKNITLLTIHNKLPNQVDNRALNIHQIKESLNKKNFHCKVIWVLYMPEKLKTQNSDNSDDKIIYYQDYQSAVEILDEFNPNYVITRPAFELTNLSFIVSSKKKNIPTITTFLEPVSQYQKSPYKDTITSFKNQLNSFLSNPGDLTKDSKNHKGTSFFKQRHNFLISTLKHLEYNKIDIFIFNFFLFKSRIFSSRPLAKIFEGKLNFCKNFDWQTKLLKVGFKKSSLKIIGHLSYDSLYYKLQNMDTNKKHLNKTRILFVTSSVHEHGVCSANKEFELINKICNEILKHDEYLLTVKIHPSSSSVDEYKKSLKEILHKIDLIQEGDLFELMNNHDVMVTYGLTTGVTTGILLKKPVIFVGLKLHRLYKSSEYNEDDYYDKTVTIECTKILDLKNLISESLSQQIPDSNYFQFIEKTLYKFDGKCSERIANYIIEDFKKFSEKQGK